MQDSVGTKIVRIGPTHNTDQRKILAVRARNRVDYTQSSNSKRDDTRAHAPAPRVAVRSVSSIKFVAASNVFQLRLRDEVVEEGEVKVTRHGEDVCHPHLHCMTSYKIRLVIDDWVIIKIHLVNLNFFY